MKYLSAIKNFFSRQLAKSPGRKRFMAGSGFLFIAFIVSFSIFATASDPVVQKTLEKAWPVSVLTILPGELSPVFSTYGKVESDNIAELRTDVVAEIAAIHVREGQWVIQGDLLIALKTNELSLRVTEREAELAQQAARLDSIKMEYRLLKETTEHFESVYRLSQKKLKRHQDLLARQMISQSLLDAAIEQASEKTIEYQAHVRMLADFPNRIAQQQAQVNRTGSHLQQAIIDLGKAEVRAPFSGPVLQVTVSVGDHTSLSTPLLKIADTEGFIIRAPVSNAYLDRFRDYLDRGKHIRATANINGNNVALSLTRLSNNIKPGQSGLDAFFQVEGLASEGLPEIGRVVDITVTLPLENDVVALPVQSIYENDRVYQVENDRLQAITVSRIGDFQTSSGQYRVLVRSELLQRGQQIITTQLPRAISGLLVNPIESGS